MKRFGFITNKYTISVLILVCLFLTDVILHKGMSRVIIPSSFTDKINAVNLPVCSNSLQQKDKHWVKAVNSIELMAKLPINTAGIQCDIYFDEMKNYFEVKNDPFITTNLNIDSLLVVYASKKTGANIWLNLKNLNDSNASFALHEINRLKDKYSLNNKMIIAGGDPKLLKSFCDNGYYTTYTIPYFNPYKITEDELIKFAGSIKDGLAKYPVSSLSGYYFQYPALKKFFPNYPILTWADNSSISIVSYVFKRQLENDEHIKVILYPFSD